MPPERGSAAEEVAATAAAMEVTGAARAARAPPAELTAAKTAVARASPLGHTRVHRRG